MKPNVMFTSAALDSSGYAEASRNYLGALVNRDEINLTARCVKFENWNTELNEKYTKILDTVLLKKDNPDIQIIHLTPENFPRLVIPGIKNIGYTVWETESLPSQWTSLCNSMDEIWVPCEWNVNVFKKSGVTVPVKKIPHCFDKEDFFRTNSIRKLPVQDDTYLFYSIFQWSARKNPEGLLQAYFSRFTKEDNVALILKTFRYNNLEKDKEEIKNLIDAVKRKLWITETPPIILIHENMSKAELMELHNAGDCFVLPHRAEGWGIPHFEAMAHNKLVIATGYSGNLEFMNTNNSMLLPYQLTPCYGMDRGTYNGKMEWAEPSIHELGNKMREVFEMGKGNFKLNENPEEVLNKFSWKTIGDQIIKELL